MASSTRFSTPPLTFNPPRASVCVRSKKKPGLNVCTLCSQGACNSRHRPPQPQHGHSVPGWQLGGPSQPLSRAYDHLALNHRALYSVRQVETRPRRPPPCRTSHASSSRPARSTAPSPPRRPPRSAPPRAKSQCAPTLRSLRASTPRTASCTTCGHRGSSCMRHPSIPGRSMIGLPLYTSSDLHLFADEELRHGAHVQHATRHVRSMATADSIY